MFEASFYAGFLHSDDSENLKETYQSAGQNIGLIFQLADDCADYETTERLARKPVLSDYKNGVVTLPLIYALRENKELADAIAGGIRPPGVEEICCCLRRDKVHTRKDIGAVPFNICCLI